MSAIPRRCLRPLAGWLVVLLAGVVALALLPPAGAAQPEVERGGQLYQRTCAVCHGTTGEGVAGQGVQSGPTLRDVDVAYVDLVVRTGRMPILEPRLGVVEQRLGDADRAALVAWMVAELGLEGDVPDVVAGDAARGQALYVTYCAACHGSTGRGGIAGDGTLVPSLTGLDATAIVEAARVGPFEMPVFEEEILPDEDAADVAAFVRELGAGRTTPLGLAEIDNVQAAGLALLLFLLVLGVVFAVDRSRSRPAHKRDE